MSNHATLRRSAPIALFLIACGNTSSPPLSEEESSVGSQASPIYGQFAAQDGTDADGNPDPDTFVRDIVVRLTAPNGDERCTGTLITPSVVLTAAHCNTADVTVGFGPSIYAFKTTRTIATNGRQAMGTGDDAFDDIALLTLDAPVWAEADSRRPAISRWYEDPQAPAESYRWPSDSFGMSGWSALVGPWECPNGPGSNAGYTDPNRVKWRYYYEGFPPDFHMIENVIFGTTDTGTRPNKGDSGGPLYRVSPGPIKYREVIGVLSKNTCSDLQLPDFHYERYSKWTNVASGPTALWIDSQLSQKNIHSANWRIFHDKPDDIWLGEGDYTGPCNGRRDPDCDHWYTEHDYCPFRYDPEQVEGATPSCLQVPSRHVNNGATQSTEPYTSTYDASEIVSGTCPPGSSGCRTGFCYWTTIHGPLWQATNGVSDFTDPSLQQGTGLAIRTLNNSYFIYNKGARDETAEWPEQPNYGPGGTMECTNFDEISAFPSASIPSCVMSSVVSWEPFPYAETGYIDVSAGPKDPSFGIPTGFLGNVAQCYKIPALSYNGWITDPDFTKVENGKLRWQQGVNLTWPYFSGGVTREATAFGCGVPNSVIYGGYTRADESQPRARLLSREQSLTSRCFISGLEGAWSRQRPDGAQPHAEITTEPDGSVWLHVSPEAPLNPPPDVSDVVAASAQCFKLR